MSNVLFLCSVHGCRRWGLLSPITQEVIVWIIGTILLVLERGLDLLPPNPPLGQQWAVRINLYPTLESNVLKDGNWTNWHTLHHRRPYILVEGPHLTDTTSTTITTTDAATRGLQFTHLLEGDLSSPRWWKLDHTQPSDCSVVMSLGMSAFQSAEWSTASEVLLTWRYLYLYWSHSGII